MNATHKQGIHLCSLLHFKRINVLQQSVVNFDEVGRFLFTRGKAIANISTRVNLVTLWSLCWNLMRFSSNGFTPNYGAALEASVRLLI